MTFASFHCVSKCGKQCALLAISHVYYHDKLKHSLICDRQDLNSGWSKGEYSAIAIAKPKVIIMKIDQLTCRECRIFPEWTKRARYLTWPCTSKWANLFERKNITFFLLALVIETRNENEVNLSNYLPLWLQLTISQISTITALDWSPKVKLDWIDSWGSQFLRPNITRCLALSLTFAVYSLSITSA